MADDVSISIGAEDKASSVLRSVASQVDAMAKSFGAIGPTLAGVGAAVAGAVAAFVTIRSAIDGVMASADRIDALSDKAAGLGESVGSLQEFQFALGEAGNVSADKAIMVLEKLSATVGSIASGENKAGVEVFKQMGLDAAELSLEGPIAQFEAIQGKLGEIENLSERAATAQKVFGKAALELLPALTAQTESMRESAEYARKVGAAVGDDAASAVASMNDAIGRVGLGLEGLYNQVAIALAPAIENIALAIADWLPPLVEMAQSVIPTMVDTVASLADGMLNVAEALGLITEREQTWAEAIQASRDAAAARADEMEAQRAAMRAAQSQGPEAEPDASQKKIDDTIAALERQLSVLKSSEQAVKFSEQLALARNDAERDRIRLLQEQITKQEALNDLAAEQKKKDEEAKKEADRIAKNLTPDTTPQSAVQGRLLSRGVGGDPALIEAKKSNQHLQSLNEKFDLMYNEAKQRSRFSGPMTRLVVP